MKRMLIAKELASMRPFLVLLLVLTLLSLFDTATGTLTNSYFDMIRFGSWHWAMEAGFLLLLGFALGSGLLAREDEEGTLHFLDGLPVERRTIFLTKLAVAASCIFIYSLIWPLLSWGITLLLRRSVDVPVDGAVLAALALRYALLSLLGVALGLLCGFIRQLSWILLALLAMGVSLLKETWPRAGAALDPTTLVADGWSTSGWDSEAIWTSLAVTLACLALAYLLFASAGGARMQRLANLAQNRAMVIGFYSLAVAVFIAFAVVTANKDVSGADDDSELPAAAGIERIAPVKANRRARHEATAHYTFTFPPKTAVDRALLKQADSAFRHAAALLSVDPRGQARIDVDLSGSIMHTAGLADLHRIRMDSGDGWYDTLVHETMHVLAARLAGAESNRELGKMSLFNEGLAHWAEPERQNREAVRVKDDLAAAIMMRRRLLAGGDLLKDGEIERNLDLEMKYPLGAKLVEALVARYGKDAPGRVLETLGDAEFPRELEDEALYRTAFQMAGYDLNLVMFDYAENLNRLAARHAALIDAMPRPRGILVVAKDMAGIALKLDRPLLAGQSLAIRFRPNEDSGVHEHIIVRRFDTSGTLPIGWLSTDRVANGQVCFQAGIAAFGRVHYEPWNCLPLRAAASVKALRR